MAHRVADTVSIQLRRRTIFFEGPGSSWQVPLAEIVLIGEATTIYGSLADDHFLCVLDGENCWLAPLTSAGSEQLLADLCNAGFPVQPEPPHRASFGSQVLWPPEVTGAPLFNYAPTWTMRWWGRVLCWFMGWRKTVIQTYTPEVEAYLRTAAPERFLPIRAELPV